MSSTYRSAVVSTKVPESPFDQPGFGESKTVKGSKTVKKISLELLVERYTKASTISCISARFADPVGKLYIIPSAFVRASVEPEQVLVLRL